MSGFSPDWWDLVPATIGALVGAASAAWPAYILARRASAEVLARDAYQRRESEKTAAFSLFSKILLLANSVLTLQRQFEEMAARQADPSSPLSRRVSAFAGLSEKEIVTFAPDDFAFLVGAGEVEYINELQLLTRRQIAIFGALQDYKARKEITQQILDAADFTENLRGDATYKLTPEQARLHRAQEIHLEAIIVPLRGQLTEAATHARELAAKLGPLLKARFPGERVPHIAGDEEAAV